MKKRMTDSDIWDDPWYRKLPCLYKELWRFLCDKCDAAGVWKVDLEMAGFFLGEPISEKRALELFNSDKERVAILDCGKWFITGFIDFQYGGMDNLSRGCNPHKPIFDSIERHGLERVNKGFGKGYLSLMDKDKDKDQDKDTPKKGYGGKHDYSPTFESFWSAYPRKVGKDKAWDAWKKKSPDLTTCINALEWQVKQDQWTKDGGQFIPHPSTWINQGRWADEKPAVMATSNIGKQVVHPLSQEVVSKKDYTDGAPANWFGKTETAGSSKGGISDEPPFNGGEK